MASPVTYITNTDLKKFTGFEHNQFLTEAVYDGHRLRAKARINTVLASRYALPLPVSGITDAMVYLSQIELLLAGGHLLWQEYGKEGIGTDKDGPEKIRQGESMLRELMEGKVSLMADDGSVLPGAGDNSTDDSRVPSGDTNTEYMFGRNLSDI